MNKSARLFCFASALALFTGHVTAGDLAIEFHPTGGVWPYPVAPARGLDGVLVQNIAVINRGDTPVSIDAIEIEILREGESLSKMRLDASRLDTTAAQGDALARSGMLKALDFQFSPDTLLGPGTQLSATRTLAPGGALLLMHSYMVYRGPADRLRVSAYPHDAARAETKELPIRVGPARGTFRFPLRGRWFIAAGATAHSHHRWVAAEEFALDLVRIGDGGKTYRGDGARMQDYYAYGAEVLAVADGEVVKVFDGEADNTAMLRGAQEPLAAYNTRLYASQDALLARGTDAVAGNHMVIAHADGVYSVYAHLKPGSLKVKAGDRVAAGQTIAALGGSGNSTEPHLHFHLCDSPDALHCAGMPARFTDIELPYSEAPRDLQSGDLVDAP